MNGFSVTGLILSLFLIVLGATMAPYTDAFGQLTLLVGSVGLLATLIVPFASKPKPEAAGDAAARLRSLQKLKDDGLIADEEYDARRKTILEGL